ncbi:prepilin-type N-terminal cleavage/methylation domain-containing protein [Lacimicrobium sp. SS2-24]|uniref:prepilin-type N-terminal cleavage/methylation domain-containing protein n=1 Tax=Lacimicrobium sp. SS2-24 TaxID=2005569 RepID=UPI000B4AE6CD|nr:prepilin-type N-terminal cleavage/methylation domain-containing protein [Lacimicrobium sp. SS2-24]
MTRHRDYGFSLIELLVALTLLTLIIFIGSYGYQTFSRYWGDELGDFGASYGKSRGLTIVVEAIKGIKPYLVVENQQPYFYFEGGESVFRAVRAKGVTTDGPAIFEIRAYREQGVDSLSLQYSELPLSRENFQQPDKWRQFSYQITILDGLEEFNLQYFGWAHFNDFAEEDGEGEGSVRSPEWYGFYSGKDTWITPMKMKMAIRFEEHVNELEVPIKTIREDLIAYHLVGDE